MNAYITAIGTSNPEHKIHQMQIHDFMQGVLSLDEREKRKLSILYKSTGIDYRHSVLEDYKFTDTHSFQFFPKSRNLEPFPLISNRMAVYEKEAPLLASSAALSSMQKRNIDKAEITHLVTVSCTGMYAPGIDIDLIRILGLKTSVHRTMVNFMGCYGAFNGLKVAESIVKAEEKAKVLVICVELCTLHFQNTSNEDQVLSSALFADGAAAVIVESLPYNEKSLRINHFYTDLLLEGKQDMSWRIGDHGFEMELSSYVPNLIGNGIEKLLLQLLNQAKLLPSDIHHYAIHPGGKRILQQIEKALNLEPAHNYSAYEVLRQYGNMSSATVLFVLSHLLDHTDENNLKGNILSMAFGPGLTVEAALLEMV